MCLAKISCAFKNYFKCIQNFHSAFKRVKGEMARKEETEKAAASPENTPGSYPTPVCLSPGTRAPESTTQSLLKH